MKDFIARELAKTPRIELKRLVLTELLQHLILQSASRLGAFRHLVFTGGTALRILHHTGRYSEALDFSFVGERNFRLRDLVKGIQKDLALQQLGFDYNVGEGKAIGRADLRFPGLLQEFNLSPLKDQKLSVKLEVDKAPPAGGVKEIALVTAPISYTVATFDLPSLFATKLHALFFRRYTKARDYYDLVWFLGRGIRANFRLLGNAIRQTEGKGKEIKEGEFKAKLLEHLKSADFKKVRAEAERFVIDREELKFLDFDSVKSLLRNY